MTEVALDWENSRPHEISAAISAVQIDNLEKIAIIRSDFDDKKVRDFTALINPKIVKFDGEIVSDFEGCLSVPDVYGKVPRYDKIRVKLLILTGMKSDSKLMGFYHASSNTR